MHVHENLIADCNYSQQHSSYEMPNYYQQYTQTSQQSNKRKQLTREQQWNDNGGRGADMTRQLCG